MLAPDLSHRRAGPGDHGLLLRLIAAYYAYDHIAFDEPVVREGLSRLLADDTFGRAYLLEQGGETAGYVLFTYGFDLEFGGRLATITDFYLEPGFRRRGLGSATLEFVSDECRALGVRALELQVEEANLPAQALYRKFGFEQLSRLPMSKQL
jgi:ribosomal protein S18 acetylase RimI-like enzyme